MTANLVTIGEHTIDASLLTPRGWVLDAGCRDLTFARGLTERGCRVMALDADPTLVNPKIENIDFYHFAIAARRGNFYLHLADNPEARCLVNADQIVEGQAYVVVMAFTIADLLQMEKAKRFDAVKLDVEGAEYDILRTWPGPVAKQISVEFHEHVKPRPEKVYDDIFAHLGQWYDVVQHDKTRRHCTHPNFWDSLMILREEFR